jgi:energy-coupling factor transporter ATP-binding protein EcfA2
MLNKVWQQPNPHGWQMKGIYKAFDAGTLMALHVPPGSGKTTVMRAVATLLRGISIILMSTLVSRWYLLPLYLFGNPDYNDECDHLPTSCGDKCSVCGGSFTKMLIPV